jgi:hypothetical protein
MKRSDGMDGSGGGSSSVIAVLMLLMMDVICVYRFGMLLILLKK